MLKKRLIRKKYLPGLLTLFALLFVFLGLLYKIRIFDFWLHLAAGRYNLTHGVILKQDIFTFSQYGFNWRDHEWLYQIYTYIIYLLWGYQGLTIIKALFVTTIYILLYKTLSPGNTREKALAWSVILLAFTGSITRLNTRPHIVSLFFTVTFLFILIKYTEGELKHPFYLLVPQALWVNIHGGTAFLGPFYTAVFLAQTLLRRQTGEDRKLYSRQVKQLLICLLFLLGLSLMNPFGYRILTYPFDKMGQSFQISILGEWQPVSPEQLDPSLIIISFLLLVAIFPAWKKKKTGTLMIAFLFAWLTIKHSRFRADFLLTSSYPVYCFLKGLKWRSASAQSAFRLTMAFLLIMAFSFFLIDLRLNAVSDLGVYWPVYPVKASNFIKRNLPGEKIINPYELGGFLMWRLPGNQYFIDGRQLPGETVFKEYYAMYNDSSPEKTSFMNVLRKYNADLVLYANDNRYLDKKYQNFGKKDWGLIYFDRGYRIYLSRRPKHQALLSSFEYRIVDPLDSKLNFYAPSLPDSNYAQAMLKELKRAREDDPKNFLVLYGLAKYYLRRKNMVKSEIILKEMVKLRPDAPSILTNLGKVLKALGKDYEAESYLRKAKALKS